MSRSVFRRLANPLSIWIALLAIVLQSVMPMVAQARMRAAEPAGVAATAAHATHAGCEPDAAAQAMPAGSDGTSTAGSDMAGHGGNAQGAAPQLATATPGQTHADAQAGASPPGHAPADPHAMHGDARCPYCRVHLDAVALPRLPNPHWIVLVSVVPGAIEIEAMPALPEAWLPTRPRGPPALS